MKLKIIACSYLNEINCTEPSLQSSLPWFPNLYLNVHFSTQVWIRHLWQLKTIVFMHWRLICTVLLTYFPPHPLVYFARWQNGLAPKLTSGPKKFIKIGTCRGLRSWSVRCRGRRQGRRWSNPRFHRSGERPWCPSLSGNNSQTIKLKPIYTLKHTTPSRKL